MGADDCLVCREVGGRVDVPGGLIANGPAVVAFHRPPIDAPLVYAGHLLVVPRRHTAEFATTTDGEAADMGMTIASLSRRLRDLGAERVYTATIGHNIEHLHVHLLPRWPGTPADVPWHGLDEHPDARHLDSAGIAELSEQLRA